LLDGLALHRLSRSAVDDLDGALFAEIAALRRGLLALGPFMALAVVLWFARLTRLTGFA
jgi:hypothetical protein